MAEEELVRVVEEVVQHPGLADDPEAQARCRRRCRDRDPGGEPAVEQRAQPVQIRADPVGAQLQDEHVGRAGGEAATGRRHLVQDVADGALPRLVRQHHRQDRKSVV